MKIFFPYFSIGILLLALKAFSNIETIGASDTDRTKNPVSTKGALLSDDSLEETRQIEDRETLIEEEKKEVFPFASGDEQKNVFSEEKEKNEMETIDQIENSEASTFEAEGNTSEETVIIEPSSSIVMDYGSKKTLIIPYSERRMKWGRFIGLSVGQAKPEDFGSNFINDGFNEIYGEDNSPGLELHTNFKRNFSSYSMGIELNLGNYKKQSNTDIIDSNLEVTFWKLGFEFALDNIFKEHAYIVPYASSGIYQILYKEQLFDISNNGTTEVSLYFSGGLMFDIDWLDPVSASAAYLESGIENTFIFIEGTYHMESNSESDPIFAGLDVKAGFKVEL